MREVPGLIPGTAQIGGSVQNCQEKVRTNSMARNDEGKNKSKQASASKHHAISISFVT